MPLLTYTLTQLNNQVVEVFGLIDGTTRLLPDGVTVNPSPTYMNNASGTAKVLDPVTGNPVVIGPSGATQVNAVYVTGTNGDYTFLITKDFVAAVGEGYTIVLDLSTPGGGVGHWELAASVRVRKG